MILELFAVLMTFSIVLIFMGYYMRADLFRLTGLTFIFLIGIAVLTTGIDYRTGSQIDTSGSITTVSNTYTNYNNRTVGFFTAIIGILGFILVLVDRRQQGGDYDD